MDKHEAFTRFFQRDIAFDSNRELFGFEKYARPYLHLWSRTSLSDAVLWTIYYETAYVEMNYAQEQVPYVREFYWRNHYKNNYRYDKDLYIRDVKLDKVIFNSLMREVNNIAIPIMVHQFKMVQDDNFYGIERAFGGSLGYRLAWSVIPPEQWQPLVDWHLKMRNYLVAKLDGIKYRDGLNGEDK